MPASVTYYLNPTLMNATLPAAAIVVLYALHQDFWFWQDARPLVFGFLLVGLFYHACYTLAATLLLWLLARYAWPTHLEQEAESPKD